MMKKNHHDDSNMLKLLLVGEGDFSASLAILRAYHHHHPLPSQLKPPASLPLVVVVMSTVLTSAKELYETYPETAFHNLQEIHNIIYRNDHRKLQDHEKSKDTVTQEIHHPTQQIDDIVLYNVDACQLHTIPTKQRLRQRLQWLLDLENGGAIYDDSHPPKNMQNTKVEEDTNLFDLVIFQYPHLGIPNTSVTATTTTTTTTTTNHCNDDNESVLRQRHISLLHHYLYSASFLSSSIHVTLNVSQYHSWIALPQQQQQQLHAEQENMDLINTNNATPIFVLSLNDNKNDTGSHTVKALLQLQKIIPVQQPFHFIFPKTANSTTTGSTIALDQYSYKHPNPDTTGIDMSVSHHPMIATAQPWSNTNRHLANEITTTNTTTTTTTTAKRRVSKKYDGGSHRHYLTKYGYHHVRTITVTTTTEDVVTQNCSTHTNTNTIPLTRNRPKKKILPVSLLGSCHYVFQRVQQVHATQSVSIDHDRTSMDQSHDGMLDHRCYSISCPICGVTCSNAKEYMIHCHNPTVYPITSRDNSTINGSSEMVNTIGVAASTTSTAPTTDGTRMQQATLPIGCHNDKDCHVDGVDRSTMKKCTSTILCEDATVCRTNVKIINTNTSMKTQSNAVFEAIVSTEHVGKRLRWFLQNGVNISGKNNSLPGIRFSKRQSERLIQNGGISINDEVVTDSSRILHDVGWVVRVDLQKGKEPVISKSTNEKDKSFDKNFEASLSATATTDAVYDMSKATAKVTIVQTYPIQRSNVSSWNNNLSFLVVWKPVGMRTIGSFTNATLEQHLYHHHQPPISHDDGLDTNSNLTENVSIVPMFQYMSLSKLDKGCSGLCVVVQQCKHHVESSTNLVKELCVRIQHTFTALIYSKNCPKAWKTGATILLPVHGLRRWKSNKRQCQQRIVKHKNTFVDGEVDSSSYVNIYGSMGFVHDDHIEDDCCSDDDDIDEEHKISSIDDMEATITVIEQTQNHEPELATISIATSTTVSGLAQTIGYYLRCNGCSIVGDRMAVQEYNTLPRAVRNRIKQRLCLGCTGVRFKVKMNNDNSSQPIDEKCFETKYPVPLNWSALHWQQFGLHSSSHT